MNKEELKQSAIDSIRKEKGLTSYWTDEEIKAEYGEEINSYILGATEATEELEAQIEKMRNCANCKNYNGNEGFCVLGSGYGYNCNLEKWEIKER